MIFRFKSNIDNQHFEINMEKCLIQASHNQIYFKVSRLYFNSNKLIGKINSYPYYNSDSGIIIFDNFGFPQDLKNYCQKLVNNRMLL
jgi:hypothetical protein